MLGSIWLISGGYNESDHSKAHCLGHLLSFTVSIGLIQLVGLSLCNPTGETDRTDE